MAVNASGRDTAQSTMWVLSVSACPISLLRPEGHVKLLSAANSTKALFHLTAKKPHPDGNKLITAELC